MAVDIDVYFFSVDGSSKSEFDIHTVDGSRLREVLLLNLTDFRVHSKPWLSQHRANR